MTTEQPRAPKCNRCRHHGISIRLKGHMKQCPFLSCGCWKCCLVTQRTRIAALQKSLRGQNQEQRPAGERTSGVTALDGGAHQPATHELPYSPSGVAPEQTATSACSPIDLRSRPAAGGENVAAMDSGELPLPPSEDGSCTPLNTPYGEFGQTAPPSVIHCPSSYVLYPNFLLNMPWSPPAYAYNNSLCGHQMIPYFHSGALHYPAPLQPDSLAAGLLHHSTCPTHGGLLGGPDISAAAEQERSTEAASCLAVQFRLVA